jgi:hypothetical protein
MVEVRRSSTPRKTIVLPFVLSNSLRANTVLELLPPSARAKLLILSVVTNRGSHTSVHEQAKGFAGRYGNMVLVRKAAEFNNSLADSLLTKFTAR